MKTGHVEKTNDRDYEVEERYGHPLFCWETRNGGGPGLSDFHMQTIQDYGGGIPTTTKRGQGLSRFTTRYDNRSLPSVCQTEHVS